MPKKPTVLQFHERCEQIYGEEWQSDDVLKDVSVDFPAGELTVIVGPLAVESQHS